MLQQNYKPRDPQFGYLVEAFGAMFRPLQEFRFLELLVHR